MNRIREKEKLLSKISRLINKTQAVVAPTSVVEIPDISFYQTTADMSKLKSKYPGVIIRAGQKNWKDPKAAEFMSSATNQGLPIGSYWYYDSRETPDAQAKMWSDVLGNVETKLMCWADYEENYGGAYSGWRNFYNFLEACKKYMPGRKLGIYTGYYYWLEKGPNLTTQAASLEYFKQYPLWLASYNPIEIVKVPKPWDKFTLWQYTEKGDGTAAGVGSLNIDLNKFFGTVEEFNTYFGVSSEQPPQGENTMTILFEGKITWADGANVRTVPTVLSNTPVRRMANGELFKAVAKHVASAGVEEWFQLEDGNWFAYLYGGILRAEFTQVNPQPQLAPTEVIITLNDGTTWKASTFARVS